MLTKFLRLGFALMIFSVVLCGCKKPSPVVAAGVDKDDSGWSVQQFYAVPEGTEYTSISCINRNTDSATCRALGNSRNWTKTNYDSLYGYYLVNPENGNSLQLSIRGDSWMRDNTPAGSLKWVNATTGWFTRAGYLFKSVDGGRRWDWQPTGCTSSVSAVDFLSDGRMGWAVGNVGLLIRTIDGSKWVCQDISNLTGHSLNAVVFLDTNFGWAVGELGSILHTETGGVSWYPQYSNTAEDLRSVYFSDRRNGWAVGAHGTILHSVNGGFDWALQTSQTIQPLLSVSFTDSVEGWAVGANGAIVHTKDGGAHWYRQSSGTHRNLRAVAFVSKRLGYAVGEGSNILKFSR